MADNRQFEALRQQFDGVTRNLKQCTHPKERRELLRRMRLVIKEVDQLILKEPSHADSKRESTVRPHTLLRSRGRRNKRAVSQPDLRDLMTRLLASIQETRISQTVAGHVCGSFW